MQYLSQTFDISNYQFKTQSKFEISKDYIIRLHQFGAKTRLLFQIMTRSSLYSCNQKTQNYWLLLLYFFQSSIFTTEGFLICIFIYITVSGQKILRVRNFCMDIDNLECLISINQIGTFEFDPKLKLFLQDIEEE